MNVKENLKQEKTLAQVRGNTEKWAENYKHSLIEIYKFETTCCILHTLHY